MRLQVKGPGEGAVLIGFHFRVCLDEVYIDGLIL